MKIEAPPPMQSRSNAEQLAATFSLAAQRLGAAATSVRLENPTMTLRDAARGAELLAEGLQRFEAIRFPIDKVVSVTPAWIEAGIASVGRHADVLRQAHAGGQGITPDMVAQWRTALADARDAANSAASLVLRFEDAIDA